MKERMKKIGFVEESSGVVNGYLFLGVSGLYSFNTLADYVDLIVYYKKRK
jgi:hypothetical protein